MKVYPKLMAVNNSGKHVPYFVVENDSKVYKITCLKTIFKSELLSKDRVRRIQGLSTYPDQADLSTACDNLLMVGDPILYSKKSLSWLTCKMKNSNKQIIQIDLSVNGLTQINLLLF